MAATVSDHELSGDELSDDELTALALAAEPDPKLDDDAVPFDAIAAPGNDPLLPAWYMPAPATVGARPGWRRRIAVVVIIAFLLINAAGLCSTYGPVTFG